MRRILSDRERIVETVNLNKKINQIVLNCIFPLGESSFSKKNIEMVFSISGRVGSHPYPAGALGAWVLELWGNPSYHFSTISFISDTSRQMVGRVLTHTANGPSVLELI